MVEAVVLEESVIVAGHPRSGTSLACQLVESAGVEFPTDFEGDEYNEGGYYELELSKDVSKRVLKKAMTDEITRDMNDIVRRLNDVSGWSGLKLVRVPAIFFYRHLAKELKAVFVYRNPANVKASLFKRGISEFSVPWIKNNNAAIAGYENIEDSIVISYESMLEEADHIKKGFDKLGLDVDMSIVSRDQRTQKDSDVYVTEDERLLHERMQQIEKESCEAHSQGII